MNHRLRKAFFCLLGLSLALMSTGCMSNPGNGEYIGDDRSNPVDFGGFLLDANEWIRIEAKHPVHNWQTIGWTKSGSNALHWNGANWYSWNKTLSIPDGYWTPAGAYMKAEVRAVRYSTNGNLKTFERGFSSYWEYDESLGDLWSDHGHGESVIIYSEGPVIK